MKKQILYIGSFLKSEKAPLLKAVFDPEKGELQILQEYKTVRPSWLCLNSEKNRLFFAKNISYFA